MALHPQAEAALAQLAVGPCPRRPRLRPGGHAPRGGRSSSPSPPRRSRSRWDTSRTWTPTGSPAGSTSPSWSSRASSAAWSTCTVAGSSSARSRPTTRTRAGWPTAPGWPSSPSTTGDRPSTASRPPPTTPTPPWGGWSSTVPRGASTPPGWPSSVTARGPTWLSWPRCATRTSSSPLCWSTRSSIHRRGSRPTPPSPSPASASSSARGTGSSTPPRRPTWSIPTWPRCAPTGSRRCRRRWSSSPSTTCSSTRDVELSRLIAAAGVAVTTTTYRGMVHGFWRQPAVYDAAVEALAEAASFLRGSVQG